MPVYVTEQRLNGGKRFISPGISMPNITDVELVLVSSEWDTKTGRVQIGIEQSIDGGANWIGVGGLDVAIGERNKFGALPNLRYSRSDGFTGLVRIWVEASTTIRLGAEGNHWTKV